MKFFFIYCLFCLLACLLALQFFCFFLCVRLYANHTCPLIMIVWASSSSVLPIDPIYILRLVQIIFLACQEEAQHVCGNICYFDTFFFCLYVFFFRYTWRSIYNFLIWIFFHVFTEEIKFIDSTIPFFSNFLFYT